MVFMFEGVNGQVEVELLNRGVEGCEQNVYWLHSGVSPKGRRARVGSE